MSEVAPQTAVAEAEKNGLVLDDDESNELRAVFSTIFPQYMVPVEELMAQLLEGQPTPAVIESLHAAIAPLVGAAETVGVETLRKALADFKATLDAILKTGRVDDAARDNVIDVFYRVKEAVQDVCATPSETSGTSSDFVKRLAAIDGVDTSCVQRVLAAGIASAAQLATAKIDEVAAVTGLDASIAARICGAFAATSTDAALAGGGQGTQAENQTDELDKGASPSPDSSDGAQLPEAPPDRRAPTAAHGTSQDYALDRKDLEGQLALVAAVRERLRLTHLLSREREALGRLESETELLRTGALALEARLAQSSAELRTEKQKAADERLALASMQREVDQTNEACEQLALQADEMTVGEISERLLQLKQRLQQHLRRG